MPLTEKDVRYVADLAHLDLTEDEVKRFLPQLDSILDYVQKLNELDTSEIEPMAQVSAGEASPPLRADEPCSTFTPEVALANAPAPGPGFFKVPRVIERE
ncbi:MAG: Asp-tRNA(Asn)/Glu-tRNA(Gln) amidotransferase subunit GatC [Terriglobia bacterium]